MLQPKTDLSAYRKVQIESADPQQIVILLYEGAIDFLNKAQDCISKSDIQGKNLYLTRCRDIILELNDALNMEVGGEIARNLRRLYLFMNRYLLQCGWQNSSQGLEKVKNMLMRLKEAWEICKSSLSKGIQSG